MQQVATEAPLLRIEGLVKDFVGTRALDDVSLEVRPGEIVAVVGHNGSGKSTLVKVLDGVYAADAGDVTLGSGEHPVGLHVIHQDLGLANQLSTVENIGVVSRSRLAGLAPVRLRKEREHARALLSRFGEPFDVTVPVSQLAPAQRAIVGIARGLDGWEHPDNVLILDEPTEALHASEVEVLFDAVRSLASQGTGIIFISHRLDEVLGIADRIVVLRDGRKVADEPRAGIEHDRLVEYVTGVTEAEVVEAARQQQDPGAEVLRVHGLRGGSLTGIDLTIGAGEVVGVAGVLGSGRESLPALLFGAIQGEAEAYDLDGRPYVQRSPAESIRRGIAFVPGDRAGAGSMRLMTARENVTLPELRSLSTRAGTIHRKRESRHVESLVERYDVRPAQPERTFAQFSGGNQQKLVFAKWLRNAPRLLLLEEPTQGVDVGAKRAIYEAVDEASAAGAAVLVCSSEAKELVRMCHRVIVLRDGSAATELSGSALTENELIKQGYGLGDRGES